MGALLGRAGYHLCQVLGTQQRRRKEGPCPGFSPRPLSDLLESGGGVGELGLGVGGVGGLGVWVGGWGGWGLGGWGVVPLDKWSEKVLSLGQRIYWLPAGRQGLIQKDGPELGEAAVRCVRARFQRHSKKGPCRALVSRALVWNDMEGSMCPRISTSVLKIKKNIYY